MSKSLLRWSANVQKSPLRWSANVKITSAVGGNKSLSTYWWSLSLVLLVVGVSLTSLLSAALALWLVTGQAHWRMVI